MPTPPPTWDQPAIDLALFHAATRDPEYWFNHGDLIVVCQSISFRISKGPLAEHSAMFRAMFDDAAEKAMVDDCPLVCLQDSPDDMRRVFKLIFPLMSSFDRRRINMSFIAGIIRLSLKYQLQGFYNEAMGYLTTYYTASFDMWVDRRGAALWQPNPMDAICAINLARLTETPSILPTAFYICAALGPDLLLGCLLEDGSRDILTPEDVLLASNMRSHLILENVNTAYLLFQPPRARVCPWRGCCTEVWTKLLQHGGLPDAAHPVASDRALDNWTVNADSLASAPTVGHMGGWSRRTLCNTCRNWLQTRDRELRRDIWFKLPQFLGITIDGWSTA